MRPAEPSDIVILLRSPNTVLPHYARALAERGVPWEADGGGDFFASTEVNVALSLLQIVDNPRQDVPLISALRSPVYGFTADQLALLRAGSRMETSTRRFAPGPSGGTGPAAPSWRNWRRCASARPIRAAISCSGGCMTAPT